jgi:signal transduction histidine kinase
LIVINKFIQLCCFSNSALAEKKLFADALIQEQRNYHQKRVARLSKHTDRNSKLTNALLVAFVAVMLLAIVYGIYVIVPGNDSGELSTSITGSAFFSSFVFLLLCIPAWMLKLVAKKHFGEWQKLISQSEYMLSYLEEMSLKVNSAEDVKQLQNVLNALNENIYIENLEWEMFMLNKDEMMIYKNRKIEQAKRAELMNEKFAREVLNTRLEIQQQTMQHIGREIHDNVGQKLVLASLYMQQLDAGNQIATSEKKIKSITNIIDESLSDLRSLSRSLTETVNPHTSLYDLIENECKKVNAAGSCKVEFEANAQQIDLSQAVKNFVLRILQEFLQNSLKHAACTEIKVSMQNEETGLTVSSLDNGQGFTMNGKKYAGIGLQNIRKRAEIIGADLRIDSTPGEGTRMRLFIPSQKLNA